MAFRIKNYILALAFFTLLMIGSSSGLDGPNHDLVLQKRNDGKEIRSRKLLAAGFVNDYDDVCANPKHDPRKKPGCKNSP